jgi:prophage DNA circulation protein
MAWSTELYTASFRGVTFECRTADDAVERALSVAEYPYRDGGAVEDLGRKPRRISLSVPIIGEGYLFELADLIAALDESGSGELVHPVFGPVTASCQSYNIRHGAAAVDSADLDIAFIEDSVDTPGIRIRQTPGSLGDKSLSFANIVAALLNAQQRAAYLNQVRRALAVLRDPAGQIPALREAQRALQDVQGITDELVTTYRTLQDPLNQPIIRGLRDTYAAFARLFQEVSANAPPYVTVTVAKAISARVLSYNLYGSTARAGEIVQLNNLRDPSLIPAGTTLTVRQA